MRIMPFEPASATPAELDENFQLELQASLHDRPADPPPTSESATARLTRPALAQQRLSYRVARSANGELVGIGYVMLLGELSTDLAAINITVRPDRRRRGVGTALLRALVTEAKDRKSLLIESLSAGSAGQSWAAALGFALVQQTARLSLDVTKVEKARWQVPAAPGYRLRSWIGSAPDELLDSYAAARNAIDEAPRGDMSFTEPEWTSQRIRDEEGTARARRCELRVVAAVAEHTGDVAGLTYLELHQHRPEVAIQQDTAVLLAHRGNGLGIWMKAANLLQLAADHPEVKLVRTTNAADNLHMLRVNEQVGFTRDEMTENREASLTELATRLGP